MDFSNYLRQTRYYYGLTLEDMGKRINYSIGHISDIENKRKVATEKFKATVRREFPRNEAFDRFLMESNETT